MIGSGCAAARSRARRATSASSTSRWPPAVRVDARTPSSAQRRTVSTLTPSWSAAAPRRMPGIYGRYLASVDRLEPALFEDLTAFGAAHERHERLGALAVHRTGQGGDLVLRRLLRQLEDDLDVVVGSWRRRVHDPDIERAG